MTEKIKNVIYPKVNTIWNKINNISNRTENFLVFLIYIITVAIRSTNTKEITLMVRYFDELIYYGYAKSFLNTGNFSLRHFAFEFSNVMYSAVIAPVMQIFRDTEYVVPAICFLNVVMICSTIFPIYILTKKIIKHKGIQLLTVSICMTLPIFSISLNLLIESLFIPLSFWTFVLIYNYFAISITDVKRKSINAFLLGFMLDFLFACKGIGGFVLVAFAITALWDIIQELKENKDLLSIKWHMLFGIETALTFIIFFIVNNWILGKVLLQNINSGEKINTNASSGLFANLSSLDQWGYFIYAIILSFLITIVAMGVLPVIMPVCFTEKFDKKDRRFVFFSECIIIVNCVLVAYMIIINETPFQLSPVHHYRYCEHYAVNFFVLFIALFLEKGVGEKIARKKVEIIVLTFCVFMGMFFQFCLNGVRLENYALGRLYSLDNHFTQLNSMFGESICLLLFKFGVIVLVVTITYLLVNPRYSKYAAIGVLMIVLFYNFTTNKIFENAYVGIIKNFKLSADIPKAIEIDKYLKTQNGKTLIVIENDFGRSAALIDTYIFETDYVTTRDLLFAIAGDDGVVDLSCEQVFAMNDGKLETYQDLDKIDFILTDGCISLSNNEADKIDIGENGTLQLYKLKNTCVFSPLDEETTFFPTRVGKSKENTFKNSNLYTLGSEIEGEIISTKDKGVLIYGPYENILPGTYQIDVYYHYTGELQDEEIIATTDVSVEYGTNTLGSCDMKAGQNMVSYTITADALFSNTELRVMTDNEGVVFEKYVITKISD